MQGGPPPDERRPQRPLPEHRHQAADEQRLDQRHLRVRRHLEAAQLEQAEPAARRVGAVELVDAELGAVRVAGQVGEQVPQRPVDQPGPRLAAGLVLLGGQPLDLGERDLHLVDGLGPALVEARRLARRADEATGEQVGQRRVPLPVRHQAGEQVGAAQQRRVDRLAAAQRQVVAAAGAGVRAVEVELLGRQPLGPRGVVERGGQVALLGPAVRRLHVDLDDAGVRGDDELGQPRVRRRAVALEDDRHREPAGRDLDQAQQVGVVLEPVGRRQEHVHVTVARLERQRRGRRVLRGRRSSRSGRAARAAGRPRGTTARRRTPGPPTRSSRAAAAGRPRCCPG